MAVVLSILLSGLFMIPGGNITAGTQSVTDTACDLHRGTCTQPLSEGAGNVTLDIRPKPVKAMTDLIFTVQIIGILSAGEIPRVDLGMPGMNMGPNRVYLKKINEKGTFTGSGIIVRCPSGKTLWQVTVTVPGFGTAEFLIDVVY
ncbi:MAG: hypothetical protein V2B19_26905 [Pseudomonadota bacterium]